MTKSHYGSSFIISSIIYIALGFVLLTFLEIPKKIIKEKPQKLIKIAIITPIPKIIPPVVTPKLPVIIPPKPKVKPKKIVKKPKPKPKKIVKKVIKKPKPKKIIKKEPQPPIVEEYFSPAPIVEREVYVPKQVATPIAPQPIAQPKVDKSAEKRAFLRTLRSQIISHKKYPKIALRRHIEGSVGVMFDIGTNGNVSNIRFLNGKSVLQKSVRNAVRSSFPINIPSSIRGQFPMYSISVTVNFKIN